MYKASLLAVGLYVALGLFVFSAGASAQLPNPLGAGNDTVQAIACSVVTFIAQRLMPPIAVLMVLYASFLFLTSSGDPSKVVAARQVLVWTAIGVGILILAPAIVALAISIVGTTQAPASCSPGAAGGKVVNVLITLINWFSWFIAVLSVAVGLYAGFLYMTARGDAAKVTTANRTLLYAVIGIAVGILAFSIIAIVESLVL